MSWLETLQEKYYKKGSFSHASPQLIRLFPYTTQSTPSKTFDELKSFFAICGEALRDLAMVDNDVDCSSSSIVSNIKDKIDTQNFSDLEHIIKTTLFDENDQIHCFHPAIFYQLSSKHKEKSISTFANFTSDIFFDSHTELAPAPDFSDDEEPINIFHSLILGNLPPLNSRNSKRDNKFYKAQDSSRDCFIQDCSLLKQDVRLYAAQLPELLKFYFFIYQIRLVESLNSFFKDSIQHPFYFSVDWESLSKGRQSFQAGWTRVEPKLLTMWSHAQCLEMLNHVPLEGLEPPFSYSEIKCWAQNVSSEKKQKAAEDINTLISFYKNCIEQLDSDMNKFHSISANDNESNDFEGRIKSFFKMVHFQFEHSNRKAAAGRYSKCLSQFATGNYLKPRGPLGHTLCLSRKQLLFLTRLCVGSNPDGKLRLTELWKEFSKRGVAFDFETQKQILILFNKLNLIEKKSDSGDAQYVRAIL